MKKFFYTFLLFFVSLNATANNYFTVAGAVNDTLRISPADLNHFTEITFCAHFDGYLDNWRLELTYPHDTIMDFDRVIRGSDMYIPYFKSDGTEDIYEAILTITPNFNNFNYNGEVVLSSSINEYGYWDYNHDGIYEPYGTIKWDPGDHNDFFTVFYYLNADCTGDSITIDGHLTSTSDARGYVVYTADFFKVIYLVVAYQLGDVNGDGRLSADDLTDLINYLLNPEAAGWDQYQIAAGDVNGSGSITIADVSALANLLLSLNSINSEDLSEIQSSFFNQVQ